MKAVCFAFTAPTCPRSLNGAKTVGMSRGVLIITGSVAALGLGAWLLLADGADDTDLADETAQKQKGRRSPRSRAADGDLDDRVVQLEKQVAALQGEVTKLRMVRGSAAARGSMLEAPDPEEIAEAPAFEGAVRDIIEGEREEARERRTDAMRERFTERHKEILDDLVITAGLGKTERKSIETLWETEAEQAIPLFMAAREGERPFSEIREEAEKLRNATDTEVESMLTPEQFEQYKEMRPGPPRGGGGGRGRRGGGPPPG